MGSGVRTGYARTICLRLCFLGLLRLWFRLRQCPDSVFKFEGVEGQFAVVFTWRLRVRVHTDMITTAIAYIKQRGGRLWTTGLSEITYSGFSFSLLRLVVSCCSFKLLGTRLSTGNLRQTRTAKSGSGVTDKRNPNITLANLVILARP